MNNININLIKIKIYYSFFTQRYTNIKFYIVKNILLIQSTYNKYI
jgi:hypothetical protein